MTGTQPSSRVAGNFNGWWVYVFGDIIGALLAVMLISLVRGLPGRADREAAEGDVLPS